MKTILLRSGVFLKRLCGFSPRISSVCENCGAPDLARRQLRRYFVDQDPRNLAPENIVVLCPPCYTRFVAANPYGISPRYGCYAFAINRGLYSRSNANR